jgi:methylmalonyl-CoA/ethylmalonyl-CoA epimerase
MAKILELREISLAVKNFDAAFKKFRALGLPHTPVWEEATPPVQARLTSMPIGNSSISIMEGLGADTAISKFVAKRGEGFFSFTFVVDDIYAIMKEWQQAGVQFVREEPIKLRNNFSVGQPIPLLLGNWTRPSTLHGLVIELQDFRNEDGSQYNPPRRPDQEPNITR